MGLLDLRWGNPKFATMVNNGNSNNRLDVAIMGDGYTTRQRDTFRADANRIVDAFRTTEPMQSYFSHFNFHRVEVFSPQSGTDDVHNGTMRTTALDTFYSPISERRLVGPDPWVMTVATMSGVPWDSILVVVNTPRRGGGTLPTMGVAYASRNSGDFPAIVIHEAGHSIAKLMDEYTSGLPDLDFAQGWSLPNVLPWANVDTNARNPKWRVWLTPNGRRPTPEVESNAGVVGAFEGGGLRKLWRLSARTSVPDEWAWRRS